MIHNKIAQAIIFAFDAHQGQKRKGGFEPYIMHPLRVFGLLIELGINDIEMLCAAILHDTVEDCNVTENEILENFGKSTYEFVVTLTEEKTLPRNERKQNTREKLSVASPKAKLIKMLDRWDNLSGKFPDVWPCEKKLQYMKESKLLIEALEKNLYDDSYSNFVRDFAAKTAKLIEQNEKSIETKRYKANGDS